MRIINSFFLASIVALAVSSCDIAKFNQNDEPKILPDGVCFTCTSGNVAIAMTKKNSEANKAPDVQLLYFTDKTGWRDVKIGDGKGGVTDSTSVVLASGEKVYFKAKATNDSLGVTSSAFNHFTTNTADNGKVDVSGNIMMLLDGSNPGTTLNHKFAFTYLFDKCTAIINASELSLPATTLSLYCYYGMFSGCTALASTPELPATNLARGCYYGMFSGCTALASAPALPATSLAMTCYYSMFEGCTALTSAPTLYATSLKSGSYTKMFYGCSKLSSVTMLATSAINSYMDNWLKDAGTQASVRNLIVDPSMVNNSAITETKGNFTVCPYYSEAPGMVATKVGNVWWAPVNCGYDAEHPYGLVYQWGRKYGQAYEAGTITPVTMAKVDDTEANKGKLGKANKTDYNWYEGGVDNNLWKEDGTGVKEPCPNGWRVATEVELTALLSGTKAWITTGGPTGDQAGYSFGTSAPYVFIPAAGYMDWVSGKTSGRGTEGAYWTSTPSTDSRFLHKTRAYGFSSSGSGWSNYTRANPFSIRCVLK